MKRYKSVSSLERFLLEKSLELKVYLDLRECNIITKLREILFFERATKKLKNPLRKVVAQGRDIFILEL